MQMKGWKDWMITILIGITAFFASQTYFQVKDIAELQQKYITNQKLDEGRISELERHSFGYDKNYLLVSEVIFPSKEDRNTSDSNCYSKELCIISDSSKRKYYKV